MGLITYAIEISLYFHIIYLWSIKIHTYILAWYELVNKQKSNDAPGYLTIHTIF